MGVIRIDDLGKSGGPSRTGVPSGSGGFKQTSQASTQKVTGKPTSSFRRITDPKTGKEIGTITVNGKTVTFKGFGRDSPQVFTSKTQLRAGEVSMDQFGVKSFSEQKVQQAKKTGFTGFRKISKEGEPDTRVTTFKGGLVEVQKGGAVQRFQGPTGITPGQVSLAEEGIKSFEEQRTIEQPSRKRITPEEESQLLGIVREEKKLKPKIMTDIPSEDVRIPENALEESRRINEILGQETPSKIKPVFERGGTITKSKEPENVLESMSKLSAKLEFQAQFKESGILKSTGLSILAFGVGVGTGLVAPFVKPSSLLTPFFEPVKTIRGIGESLILSPSKTIGEITGTALLPTVIKGTTTFGKGQFIKAGAEFIPPEQVFAESVLSGKETLPTAKSIPEVIKRFEATKLPSGDIEVSTVGPRGLGGDVAKVGKKAGLGLEDPGVFTTPAGEGSPFFTRLSKDTPTSSSLNPLADLENIIGIPTVTEITAKGISRQPKSVTQIPGFTETSKFLESIGEKQTGQVFVTKRAQLGLGELKRQKFIEPVKGRKVTESGTSEIEAVIPPGQKIITKAQAKMFTTFEGKPVRIRKAELLVEGPQIAKGGKLPKQKTITPKKLKFESESLSQLSKPLSPTSRLASISGISKGSRISESKISKLSSSISRATSNLSKSSPLRSDISRKVSDISPRRGISRASRSNISRINRALSGLSGGSGRSTVRGGSSVLGGSSGFGLSGGGSAMSRMVGSGISKVVSKRVLLPKFEDDTFKTIIKAKRKKIPPRSRYSPSLVAVHKKIFGKKPKPLTGLGVRPISL